MQQIDWAKTSAAVDLPGRLFAQARKRLGSDAPARAACQSVLENLAANNWAALREAPVDEKTPAQFLQEIADTMLCDEVRRHVDWPALFFGDSLPERLNGEANRRFNRSPDADSAYNYALEQICADDWRKPGEGYRGKGSAQGYLRVMFLNLLEEYRVRKYGKRRPPQWVRRLGWERIYRMYCLQRLEAEEIVSLLCACAQAGAAEIRDAIREIGGRVRNCRQGLGEVAVAGVDLEDHVDDEKTASTPASHVLEQEEFQALLEILRIRVTGRPRETAADTPAEPVAEPAVALEAALALEDREILLLRLIYHEGLSIPKAARAMRPPLHEQTARRLHRALVARIRDTLTAAGLEASTI